MKVAIVTPYHKVQNTTYLLKAINSVQQQTHNNCFHVLVGDGCNSQVIPDCDNILQLNLSHNIDDYGDSPRSLGAIYAFAMGADAVAFLDSDNWFAAEHIASLLELYRTHKADVLTCRRYLTHLDGRTMGLCPESDGRGFCDTGCMLFMKSAKGIASSWWTIPDEWHAIDDRVIWDRVLGSGFSVAHSEQPTLYYRTAFEFHYRQFGVIPPASSKKGYEIAELHSAMATFKARAQARW